MRLTDGSMSVAFGNAPEVDATGPAAILISGSDRRFRFSAAGLNIRDRFWPRADDDRSRSYFFFDPWMTVSPRHAHIALAPVSLSIPKRLATGPRRTVVQTRGITALS
jgi:hypothetical protein